MTTTTNTTDANKALVLAGIKGVFIDRDPTVLDRLFSDDHRQHNPQIVVCSIRWDAYGSWCGDALWKPGARKERVAAAGVHRALGLDAAGDHLTQIHRRASRRTITVVTRFSGRSTPGAQPHKQGDRPPPSQKISAICAVFSALSEHGADSALGAENTAQTARGRSTA